MPSNQQHDSERPAFPYSIGDEVRWNGKRCTVRDLLPSVPEKIVIEIPGRYYLEWVPISELTDAPDQDQAAELGAFLCNPQAVLRGEE